MRTVYVNGSYLPENEAKISVFDRGFIFADAVYEVTAVVDGKLVDFDGHIARFKRSLRAIQIMKSIDESEFLNTHEELIARNSLNEGLIYLQMSRGVADRDFLFSPDQLAPTIVLFTQNRSLIENPLAARGQRVVTAEDLRWRRGDIKTVQLLYACMVKTMAAARGADDVWLMRDGFITEGASSNSYIVTRQDRVITRDLSADVLGGITRASVLECAKELGFEIEERPFSLAEAADAKEAFSTSASSMVMPVVQIDNFIIGSGRSGLITNKIRTLYLEKIHQK